MALLRSVDEHLDGPRIPGMGPGHGRRVERETAQGVIEPRRGRDVARARLQIRLRPAGTQGHTPGMGRHTCGIFQYPVSAPSAKPPTRSGRVRALRIAILPRVAAHGPAEIPGHRPGDLTSTAI